MKNIKNKLLVIPITFLAIVLAGCTNTSTESGKDDTYSSTQTATSISSPVATNNISIDNYTFSPSTIVISVGTEVTFTNNDSAPHRPVSDSNVFDFGQINPGNDSKQTLNQTGTFPYYCSIHPSMSGIIIVQ